MNARTAAWPAGEVSTIGAVGVAHFCSHLLQLALAPLFLMMRAELGVSFFALGAVLAVFYLFSGVGQVTAGILVDRFGAHRLLLGGVLLQGTATAAMGLAPHYVVLLPLAALAGLGNSVYHPADLSILSHKVAPVRLGRAFAAHVIAGSIGFALSPLVSAAIAAAFGWRTALGAMGLGVVVLGLVLLACRKALKVEPGHGTAHGAKAAHGPAPTFFQVLAMPVVLMAFLYFLLTSISLSGIQSFSIVALKEGFGATVALATLAVTLYQCGNAAGVALGGAVADRTARHHLIAMGGLAVACALALLAAALVVPPEATVGLVALVGFAMGMTTPSRDVLVRSAAPVGATGKVFGVVYSGYDIGALVGPLMFGLMLDHHLPRLVFVGAAIPLGLAVMTAFAVRRQPA
ncbi:MFS transporter [Xanthobacter autotrophicus]|uniref:MFS transporter n=1 Tax=Xanthobacter autotrophicus TaxID=280 RepID=UPI0024A7A1A2|nr:MFS transporter [Xanthobacter autotrophicus]MDI4657787.1 MFS transporter [Xanthobacter autotrophicus]